ncbi:enoyl-CoA hydratase/isomerase family protein [Bordetella tumulicola]|uniref:enoyl-CoA hydratase/isomerase family protein n=1 Tax=Bordetella tumulicola TaxID=1649133 RepID=UPI0039EF5E75
MEEQQASTPVLSIEGAVATIRLNRPAQANRIEPDDQDALIQHCQRIATDPHIRAVILTGTGKHFSAGADLTTLLESGDATPDATVTINPFAVMVDAVEHLPQPVICALNGGIYGGATDLALACDLRLGTPAVKMFMPAARLGLHYYIGGMRRYVSRLGFNTAKRLFLFAETLDAEQMLATGFIDRIVPADQLQDAAREAAFTVAGMAPLAVQGMKAALNDLAQERLDPDAFALRETQCLRSSDIREGVAAWKEKRPPRFEGR